VTLPEVLTPEKCAEILQVTTLVVRRMCKRGEVPGARRVGRDWRIPAMAIGKLFELPGAGTSAPTMPLVSRGEEFTSAEAATILKVSERSVRGMCVRGELPGAHHLGSRWRIPATAVEKLFELAAGLQRPRGMNPSVYAGK